MEKTLPPNWSHIKGSFYIVRTQAGFRQAMKHFRQGDKDEINCVGFPESYPSVVSFSYDYNGSIYLVANVIHVEKMKTALKEA